MLNYLTQNKRTFIVIIAALIVIIASLVILNTKNNNNSDEITKIEESTNATSVTVTPTPEVSVAKLESLTSELALINNEYKNDTSQTSRNEKLSKLKQIAVERKGSLIALMQTSPGVALEKATLAKSRADYPQDIQNDLERESIVEGMLLVDIEDNINDHTAKTSYFLEDEDRNILVELHLEKELLNEENSKIKIHGIILDKHMVPFKS